MKKTDIGMMAFTSGNDIEKNSTKSIFIFNCGYYIIHKKTTDLKELKNTAGYLLVYLHRGTMRVLIDGKFIPLEEGHVLIFHPQQIRDIIYDSNEENERYFVYFQGPEVPRFLKQLNIYDETIYKTGSMPYIIEKFKKIIADYKINDFDHDLNRLRTLLSILDTVSRSIYSTGLASVRKKSETTNMVIEIMESSYNKNYNLKHYAELCNESVPTFIRHFKQQVGIPPIKYINNLKIEVAKSFLISTNMPISEISFNLGMQDPLYFCNFFKKNTGVSPTKYREQNKLNDE